MISDHQWLGRDAENEGLAADLGSAFRTFQTTQHYQVPSNWALQSGEMFVAATLDLTCDAFRGKITAKHAQLQDAT